MEKSYYLSSTFNNVVFENRNQTYGAYQLRRVYDRNIKLAVVCATIVFSSALAAPVIKDNFFPEPTQKAIPKDKPKDDTEIIVIETLPKFEQPKVEEQVAVVAKEKVKTEVYTEPKVVPDDAPVEEKTMANQEDLKDAVFGKEKIDGIKVPVPDAVITSEAPSGLGEGTETDDNNTIFIHAEVMPEFEGGDKAMMNYISKKIKYPSAAQRENIQGLVVVTFVVAPDGTIQDAQVLKGLGYGTDEEALRVVKGMPKWKPGKQNGRPVSVRYTLPLRFNMR